MSALDDLIAGYHRFRTSEWAAERERWAALAKGHEKCGGVAAALDRSFAGAEPGQGGFIAHWVDLLDSARERVLASHAADDPQVPAIMEHEAVRTSLANLRSFPFVAAGEAAGRLRLTGGRFSIRAGELELLDEDTGRFSAV